MKYTNDVTYPAPVLRITYGESDALPSFLDGTSSIKVVLQDWNVVLDTKATKNAYMPMANLTFIETK